MIAQSQRIKTLDDVKITNATIEGYAQSSSLSSYLPLTGGTLTGGLTGTSLTLSGTLSLSNGTLNASSTAHITGRFSLGENLTFSATSATTTIPSSLRNAFAFATTSAPTPFLTFDTTNYRIGIGSTSPVATFSLKGSQYLAGGLGVGNATTTAGVLETSGLSYFGGILKGASTFTFAGTGTSTIAGRLEITASSTVAGYRICTQQNNVCPSPWSSSGGLTTLSTATDLVGLGTSTPVEKLSVNGGVYFDSDIIRFGSSSAPTLNFRYFASSTSTIPNLTSAFTFATSTTNTPLLTLSTKSSRYGRVGIGTSTPSALFAINALNSSNQADNLFYIGSSTQNTLTVDSHGFVGIGTSSHSALFSLYAPSGGKRILSIGSSTNSFFIIDADGHVAIGTTTNTAELNVTGTINAKAYNVGGTKVLPNGFIAYYTGSCPTGWTEYTTARGRYVVGTPSAGTAEGLGGTALTNLEERATGKHDHSISDAGHGHYGNHSDPGTQGMLFRGAVQGATAGPTATTGITITATSSVNGTNAPYVQLTACKAPAGSDYAEYYPTRDPSLLPGELVALDLKNPGMIKRMRIDDPGSSILIGIISTQPGYVIGNLFEEDGKDGIYQRPIALNGRALVRVSLENGPIVVGDRIAPSSLPGVGRKANQNDQMAGIALQPFNEALRAEGIKAIEVFIRFSSSDIDDGIAALANNPSRQECSQHSCPPSPRPTGLSLRGGTEDAGASSVGLWSINQTTGRLTTSYGLDLGGSSIQNVSAIRQLADSALSKWSIDENGLLVVEEVRAKKVSTKEIELEDSNTTEPYCVKITSGALFTTPGKCGEKEISSP